MIYISVVAACHTQINFTKGLSQIGIENDDLESKGDDGVSERINRFRDTAYPQGEKSLLTDLRVLIVDDSATCRNINHCLFKERGHTVVEADCGFVALQMVQNALKAVSYGAKASFDVILISNQIKGMQAQEATRLIREVGFEGIIIATVMPIQQHEANSSLNHGADLVLHKPLNIDELANAVKGWLMCLILFLYPTMPNMRQCPTSH